MKGKVKGLIGLICVVAILVFVYLRVFHKEETAVYESRPTVSTTAPQTGDIVLYTDLTGQVQPQSKAAVMPKMPGEVLEVLFQAGDRVTAGQPLVVLDSDALTALKLQVEAAQVALNNANNALARTRSLYEGGFVSQETMEQAQNGAESARISYESAKNQYDLQSEYTTITAPIDGVVESRNVEVHGYVSSTSPICIISGDNEMEVSFGVTERTLQNLAVGDTVSVEKNGSTMEGTVTEIGSVVGATGLFDVKASIPNSNVLVNGTRVKLSVVLDRANGVMTIPVDSVNYDNGTPFVYCYENGVAKKTVIEAGIYDSERIAVLSGLDANSQVITSWSNELVDGAEVLLLDESATPSDTEAATEAETTAQAN